MVLFSRLNICIEILKTLCTAPFKVGNKQNKAPVCSNRKKGDNYKKGGDFIKSIYFCFHTFIYAMQIEPEFIFCHIIAWSFNAHNDYIKVLL